MGQFDSVIIDLRSRATALRSRATMEEKSAEEWLDDARLAKLRAEDLRREADECSAAADALLVSERAPVTT
jgi:hypothetical protein